MKGRKEAAQITKASKSNLALSFFSLPRERRQDITTFYAFCRRIDDIGDEKHRSVQERHDGLDFWSAAVVAPQPEEPAFAASVREVIARYGISSDLLREIIEGVRMDVAGTRYSTFEELYLYCWRVASAVGLVSIEIFGYKNPRCKEYAVALGLALQLTNIIRDVAVDFENGERIYLPLRDLQQFNVTEEDLRSRQGGAGFRALMEFQAQRAESYYKQAVELLPAEDRRSMVAAEIMRNVYSRMLQRMRADKYQVFGRKYSLNTLEKMLTVAGVMVGHWFGGHG